MKSIKRLLPSLMVLLLVFTMQSPSVFAYAETDFFVGGEKAAPATYEQEEPGAESPQQEGEKEDPVSGLSGSDSGQNNTNATDDGSGAITDDSAGSNDTGAAQEAAGGQDDAKTEQTTSDESDDLKSAPDAATGSEDDAESEDTAGSDDAAAPEDENSAPLLRAGGDSPNVLTANISLSAPHQEDASIIDVDGLEIRIQIHDPNDNDKVLAETTYPVSKDMFAFESWAEATIEVPVKDGVEITSSESSDDPHLYKAKIGLYDANGKLQKDLWTNTDQDAYVDQRNVIYWRSDEKSSWYGEYYYVETKRICYLKRDSYEDLSFTAEQSEHVTENTSGAVEFRPMTELSQLQGNKHYIVMTKSPKDGKWYALACNDTGNQVILDSLDGKSYDDILGTDFTYKMSATDVKKVDYVLKAKDVTSPTARFYTNLRDENGKEIKLKQGSDVWHAFPLFSTSSGGITLEKDTTDPDHQLWRLRHDNGTILGFVTELFGGSFFNGVYYENSYYDGYKDNFTLNNNDGLLTVGMLYNTEHWFYFNKYPIDKLQDEYAEALIYSAGVMDVSSQYCTADYVAEAKKYAHPTTFVILTDAEPAEEESFEEDIPDAPEMREYYKIQDLSELRAGDEIVITPYSSYPRNTFSNKTTIKNGVSYLTGGTYTIETPQGHGSYDYDSRILRTSSDNALILGDDLDGMNAADGHRKFSFAKVCASGDPEYVRINNGDCEFQNQEKSISFFNTDSTYSGEFYMHGNNSSSWLNHVYDRTARTYTWICGEQNYDARLSIYVRQRYKINYHYAGPLGEAGTENPVTSWSGNSYEYTKDDVWRVQYANRYANLEASCGEDSYTFPDHWYINAYKPEYKLLGWTSDPDQPRYLSHEESCNIYEYNSDEGTGQVSKEVRDKYKLMGLGHMEASNTIKVDSKEIQALMQKSEDKRTLDLYPIFVERGYTGPVSVEDDKGNAVVGVGDWKDAQNLGEKEYEWYKSMYMQSWLGSIDVEVYKDGEKWCKPQKLYFMYHNDDSADLNIKFIDDELLEKYKEPSGNPDDDPSSYSLIVNSPLNNYLLDGSAFPKRSQIDNYVIDYVVAEQGSKEDGLKYKLNWMSESGGQLDNVRGGSTVKIYVTTKYQVKYFLDGVSLDASSGKLVPALDDSGVPTDSVELTEEIAGADTWVNPSEYATTQTEVAALKNEKDITVKADSDDVKIRGIIDKETEDVDGDQWYLPPKEELRSTYGTYLYDLNAYLHEIPVADSPAALVPAGYSLVDGSKWEIRDKDDETISEAAINSTMLVHVAAGNGTSGQGLFGLFAAPGRPFNLRKALQEAGLTQQAFKSEDDDLPTYHLHMTIAKGEEPETVELSVVKEWEDDGHTDQRPRSIEVILLADGEETDNVLTLSADNDWKGTFTELPADKDGTAIEYSVKEVEVDGYTSSTGEVTDASDGKYEVTITNTYIDEESPEPTPDPDEPTPEPDEPGTPDNPSNPGSPDSPSDTAKTVNTGDSTDIGLFVALMAISASTLAVLAFKRKRRDS